MKLKIAVGITGYILALESFPNDEEHAGLNELLGDLVDNSCVDEESGVYTADLSVEMTDYGDPTTDFAYLAITKLTRIDM